MKTLPLLTAAAILCGAITTYAQDAAAPAKKGLLKYSAPKGASDTARKDGDGGSRGTSDKDQLPILKVLTPKHAALTNNASPSLFWYQSAGSDKPFELSLNEPGVAQPILKLPSKTGSPKAGVRRISLARYNVTLKPDVEYKWSVKFVADPNNQSLNRVASGAIKYVKLDDKVAAAAGDKKGLELAEVYAQAGIWYDALEAISNAIEAEPTNKELRSTRADLLEQAGLKDAADSERKQ